MEEQRSKNNSWKVALIMGAMIGSLYIGDRYQPMQSLKDRSFYHNSSMEDGYYQKPLDLDIVETRNSRNRIEVYLVDKVTNDSLAIRENMHVGTTGNTIDDFVDEKKSGIKNWWKEMRSDSTSLLYKKNKNAQ